MYINITSKAFSKMKYFIEESNGEITGLGKVKIIGNSQETIYKKDEEAKEVIEESIILPQFLIYDIEILEQEISEVSAVLNEQALGQFLFNKLKNKEKVEDYKVWWHSHSEMQAFFSATDDGTIEDSTEFPYLISIVGNKAGDFLTRIDIQKPFRMTINDIELKVEPSENSTLRNKCIQEIKEKVSQKTFWGDKKHGGKKDNRPWWEELPEYQDPFFPMSKGKKSPYLQL